MLGPSNSGALVLVAVVMKFHTAGDIDPASPTVNLHIHTYIYIHVFVYIYIYVYLYICTVLPDFHGLWYVMSCRICTLSRSTWVGSLGSPVVGSSSADDAQVWKRFGGGYAEIQVMALGLGLQIVQSRQYLYTLGPQ